MCTLRRISPKCGGLGIPAHSGIKAEAAILLSRALTSTYVTKYRPTLVAIMGSSTVWPEIHFGSGLEDLVDLSDEERIQLHSTVESDLKKATKNVIERIDYKIAELVTEEFDLDAAGLSKRAIMRSRQGVGSKGAWWRSLSLNEGGNKTFPDADYKAAMRHLVFAPIRNTRGEAITHCGCCRVGLQTPVNIEHLYSHARGCKKAGNFTWRHDDIVKALFSLLKRGFLHGGELANRVTMEESLERQDGSGLQVAVVRLGSSMLPWWT